MVCRGVDILIKAAPNTEHLNTLSKTFQHLTDHGVHLGKDKCKSIQEKVDMMQSKVEAVLEAPAPTNVTELKSYLGLLNYYNGFIPGMTDTLHDPLH